MDKEKKEKLQEKINEVTEKVYDGVNIRGGLDNMYNVVDKIRTIALSILCNSNQLSSKNICNSAFAGELALDGSIRPIRGVINIIEIAKKANIKQIFIPIKNLQQASLISGIKIIPVQSLKELFFACLIYVNVKII